MRTILVEADESVTFSTVQINATPGETLQIVLRNAAPSNVSEVPHRIAFLQREFTADELTEATMIPNEDLTIPDSLREICLGESKIVGPGEETTLVLEAPLESGNYTFFCPIPGHAFLGMRGILKISE